DLKPGNVLVAGSNGRATPKVIDFGVAKATAGRPTESTPFTGPSALIGSPADRSPGPAEVGAPGGGQRSDIFSPGVLVDELLTGSTPFDGERLRAASYEEMRRIIKEEEPLKPSAQLEKLSVRARRVGRSDCGRMAGVARGDLDWIVMKCLEKDRARRY